MCYGGDFRKLRRGTFTGTISVVGLAKKPRTFGGARDTTASGYYARASSDNPIVNAFCRVAPSVRFRVRAMFAARVFFFASVFNVRTSDAVHSRRFDFLVI
jgi:hypothetical protein